MLKLLLKPYMFKDDKKMTSEQDGAKSCVSNYLDLNSKSF